MYENNYSDNTYHYEEPVKKQEEQHNKKKGSGNGKKIALGICCGLLFGIFAGIGFEAVTTASSLAKNAVTKETTAQPEIQSPSVAMEMLLMVSLLISESCTAMTARSLSASVPLICAWL